MTAPSVRSLSFSLILHATFLGALAFFLTSQSEKITQPLSSLFTLVPTLDAPSTSLPGETSHPISVSLPIAPPTARSAPTPPAAITAPAKTIPTPTRSIAPKAPARLTENEFRRQHGSQQTSTRPVAQLTPTPRVSENFSPARTSSSTGSVSKNPAATITDDLSFTPALLRDLRAAFVSAGISTTGLSAVVEFTFDEVGIFKTVRVVRSSSDATFDAAVLAAFAQVRARGFPPEAAGQSYRVTFQITGS